MATSVLDTSVLLAAINDEPGAAIATSLIPTALVSTVNFAELATKLTEKGMSRTEVMEVAGALECEVVPFDASMAMDAGILRSLTRKQGLSLGDRACLALALERELPVYTAERSWSEVKVGLDIRLIR